MIPNFSDIDLNSLEVQAYPSNTHKITGDKIIGFVDGIEAIKQMVTHVLSTERYAYAIYDEDYGSEIEQFLGKSFEYVEANISRVIKDALMQDDRITNVVINSVLKNSLNQCEILFTVYSKLGTFKQGVLINV